MGSRANQVPVEIVTDEQWVALDRLFCRMRELKEVANQRRAKALGLKS